MSAFSTTFSDFCAGNTGLPQVLSALRDDLVRNRQALFDDSALIDWAWRSGRVDREAYQALRDTITDFDPSTPRASSEAGDDWPAIRATRYDDLAGPEPPDQDEPTRHRSSLRTLTRLRGARPSAPPPSISSNPWSSGGAAWSDAQDVNVQAGMTLKARFVLEEVVGRGDMGVVYRARDIRREEAQDRYPFVAVKVLNEDFRRRPESFKALQREAKKSQSLAHPNVASVFDFDRDGPIVFLVMELLEGESLQEMIENRAGRGLPRAEVWRILRSIGAALAYAHEKGVVHSDFKPANVIRTRDGAIKVLDFGIARAIALPTGGAVDTTRFDVSALHALTPAYASSEMLIGERAHPADDVFALACVTYELLCGRHPFGRLPALIAERQRLEPIPIAGLDRRAWRALAHGLAFARADRTQSVEQFLAELTPRRYRGAAFAAIAATLAAAAVGAWFYTSQSPEKANALLESVARAREGVLGAPTRSSVIAPDSVPPEVAQSAPAQSFQPAPVLSEAALPARGAEHDVARTATASVYGESDSSGWDTPMTEGANQAAVLAEAGSTPAAAPAAPVRAPIVRPAREFSLEQRKQRVIAFARMDEIPDALQALREVEARLDADDLFLLQDAPRAIAQAYSRVSEREFESGNYPAALALLDRAGEMTPELPIYAERRAQVARVAEVEETLAQETPPSVEEVQVLLTRIRADAGPDYYAIRNRLAAKVVQRVRMLRDSSPEQAGVWAELGQHAFAGAAPIEALEEEAAMPKLSPTPSAADVAIDGRQP